MKIPQWRRSVGLREAQWNVVQGRYLAEVVLTWRDADERVPKRPQEVGMAWEMMVGLFVADPEVYRQYRDAMRPLLESVGGGGFRYDFEVARTLKSEAGHDINRVFAIYFADRESKDRFFSNPDYVRIRADLFQKAVRGSTILAGYER